MEKGVFTDNVSRIETEKLYVLLAAYEPEFSDLEFQLAPSFHKMFVLKKGERRNHRAS